MHPILFKAFGQNISSWGAMVFIGLIGSLIVALMLSKREGIEREDVFALFGCLFFFGLVGGRLFYVLANTGQFLADPLMIFALSRGGFSNYGAAILSSVSGLIYARHFRMNILKIFDMAFPGIMLCYSIAKLGCLLNGCCYGVACDLPFGVTFAGVAGARHPTQIYSSLLVFLIFAVLVFVSARKRRDGQVFLLGGTLFVLHRFVLSFLTDEPGVLFGMSFPQLISAVFFAVAASIYLFLFIRKRAG